MNSAERIAGYILAGGKSSRMGTDKGLLLLDEKPMVQHIAEAISPVVQTITILSANQVYADFGYPLLADDVPEKGPLGGITTALRHTKTEYNLIVSCDMPGLTSAAVRWFLAGCTNAEINVAVVGEQWHPLLGLYKKSCLLGFAANIAASQLALQKAIRQMDYNLVPMEKYAGALANINTKIEFETLKQKHHAR